MCSAGTKSTVFQSGEPINIRTGRFLHHLNTFMTTKIKKSPSVEKPVWFITGCSSGFGRELAAQALARAAFARW